MTGPFKKLDRNIVFACIQQGAFLVLGLLAPDGWMVERSVLGSMLAYWMGVAFILSRHQRSPTVPASDKYFIRWGFLLLWAVLAVIVAVLTLVTPGK